MVVGTPFVEDGMRTAERKKVLVKREPTDAYWVGTNLCRLRLEKKLTQEALARAAGISARRLRDIENADEGPNTTLGTLSALAAALGVPTPALLKPRKGDWALQI
jgi:DNA-binding Xre family transcriptional regulator